MTAFKELIEKMRHAKRKDSPYVIYSKPNDSRVTLLIQKDRRLELVNSYEGSGFIMAPFDEREASVLISLDNSWVYHSHYDVSSEHTPLILKHSKAEGTGEQLKKTHVALVKKGKQFLVQNNVAKVVLSREEVIPLKEFDIGTIFQQLLLAHPNAFVYNWFHPERGIWMGASPETLLRTRDTVFSTMALAGTQKFDGTEAVTWAEKETEEQQLVTDHIVKSLGQIPHAVGQTYTKRAGNLLHICTDITGELNEKISLSSLIRRLHPTAAVCGLPQEAARRFILAQEGYQRSYYTGFIGELNLESPIGNGISGEHKFQRTSNLFVNLRCMRLSEAGQKKAVLYIGGGITAGSDPEAEWQETVEKSLLMKSVIGESEDLSVSE